MDGLTLFGLFSVSAMLACYALEDRNHIFVLAFAAACALGSIYGFHAGRLAIRIDRGDLGRRRAAALETQAAFAGIATPRFAVLVSSKPRHRCRIPPSSNEYFHVA